MTQIKGWRTVGFNIGVAAGTAALNSIAGINWVDIVGPTWAMLIVAGANIALRAITTTPIGVK